MEQTDLSKLKKPTLIAIIFVIIIILFVIGVLISGSSNSKNVKEQSEERLELIQEKIPYATQEFSVSYSEKKDQIYINALKPPYEENQEKAVNWLKQNGYKPENLDIIYFP